MTGVTKPRSGLARWALAALGATLASAALAACGSSSHTSATTAAGFKVPPIDAPCQQVAAVLSNGPDPGADPLGYAQAQIRQLRLLKLSEPKLAGAVSALASAYQRFSDTNGSATAKVAVSKTSKAVNAICPGAAS
jgi:hypothetical protein